MSSFCCLALESEHCCLSICLRTGLVLQPQLLSDGQKEWHVGSHFSKLTCWRMPESGEAQHQSVLPLQWLRVASEVQAGWVCVFFVDMSVLCGKEW